MMKKLFLIFSHSLTEEQSEGAINQLGIQQTVVLPKELQNSWSQVPTDANLNFEKYLAPIVEFISKDYQKGDYALVQGDFGTTCYLVGKLKNKGIIPVYAMTERVSEEQLKDDGSIEVKKVFKYAGFRKY